MTEEIELENSEAPEETELVEETELSEGDEPTLEDYQKLVEKNKQLYARIKKNEGKKETKEEINKLNDKPKLKTEAERLERLELRIDGYAESEIDFILKNGGKEATSDPFVKKAIEAIRQDIQSANATPELSGKSPIYKRYSQNDLESMSLEQLEKIVPRD